MAIGQKGYGTISLFAPVANNTYINSVFVSYSLTGSASQIELVFTYTSGYSTASIGSTWTLTMNANTSSASFTFNPNNLGSSSNSFTSSPTTSMPDGTYSVYAQYIQAGTGVSFKSATITNVFITWVTATPSFTTSPSVTINTSTNVITLANHGLSNNSPVTVSGTNASPNTTYYVSVIDANTFKLVTAPGGSTVFHFTTSSSPTVSYPVLASGSVFPGTTAFLYYTLGETPSVGSASLTFAGPVTVTLGLPNNLQTERFTLDRTNIVASSAIRSTSATTLPDGAYTVTLSYSDAYGHSAATAALTSVTFASLPTVTAITPLSGASSGGAGVTITGTNFTGATAVNFGATAATSFTVNSATQITATAPAGSAGASDVTVTTVGGTSATSSADQFTYIAAPTVTGVSPANGVLAGGATVTIAGTNFTGATMVKFGITAATSFTVNSATSITATAPGGSAGAKDITVTTIGGSSATSAADQFTYVAVPTVTGVSPANGVLAGGSTVTITGTNFTAATAVSFGAMAATSFTVNSATSITATVPAGASGASDITVTTVGGTSATSSSDQFTYVPAPTVSGVSPASGPTSAGTAVTVTGANFTGATAVNFGATPATGFTVNSATQIIATSPAGSAGVSDITVATVGGTSATSSADQFTYIAAPAVTGVSPASGVLAGGSPVTITGSNFTGATAVKFGTAAATSFTVTGATSITATVPPGASGSSDITVTTVGGTSATSGSDEFTYVPIPSVTAVSPVIGPTSAGTTVTVTGTNLTGATAVNFGGTAATGFTVNSATQITATAPGGPAGLSDITVTTVGGTSATSSADQFTCVAAPVVTGVSPSAGVLAGGPTVTITGTNFAGATAVSFGTMAATSYTVNSATSITATVPAGASGASDITVTTVGGTSATSSNDQFTYVPAPAVSGVSPASGPTSAGTAVTVTGANFTGATAVNFGATPATGFAVNSATQIIATSPAGSAGVSDITVTTVGGTSATNPADQFTYIAAPTVTGVNPVNGILSGGSTVTITGSNFTGATAVKFGATAATSFSVNGAGLITATVPAGASGSSDITVTTIGGTSATSGSDQFTYVPAPTIASVSPSSGPTGSGTTVTISGNNFAGATAVNFGTTAATSFTLSGPTQITATAPSGSAGASDITVTTAGGTSATSSADQFTYVAAPVVIGVSPASGILAGGATVRITGTNFTGATAVKFGATAATSFTVNGATSITATVPAGAPGSSDITVSTVGGTSATSGSDQFTYVAAPTVTSVSPATGPTSAGTTVTITGAHFTGASAVNFGSTPAKGFTVNSATQITATAPGGSAGVNDIAVTTVGGTSATGSADQFTYVAAPAITGSAVASAVYGTSFSYAISALNGPASYSFSGALPGGITFDPSAGVMSGSPTSTGIFPVTIAATNAGGTGTASLVITVTPAAASVILGNLNQTYSGLPLAASAFTNPSGLPLTVTYRDAQGMTVTPVEAGNYFVTAQVNSGGYTGLAVGTLVILPLNQVIAFKTAAAGVVGAPVTLSASASSGLPVGFSLVSGNATLSGSTLIPLDINPIVVQATQPGNENVAAAAPVLQTIGASSKEAQTIAFAPIADQLSPAQPIMLNATASSGLPVSFMITSGPAILSGPSAVTLTGAPGLVTVTASQAGNATYAAAPGVTNSFNVIASGPSAYVGSITGVSTLSRSTGSSADASSASGSFAATIDASRTTGMLIGIFNGSGFELPIALSADGTFVAQTTALSSSGANGSGSLTFSGRLQGNVLSGTIAELNASFSATADPQTGATSDISGFYQSAEINSAAGNTYSVVGTQNEVYVLAVSPSIVAAGAGTVSSTNTFAVQTPQSAMISGSIDPITTTVTGTVTTNSGNTSAFAGLAAATTPLSQLANLSFLGPVTGSSALVAGFSVGGTSSKTLLLRGIGPGLTTLGVAGALARPHLQLFDGAGTVLADNAGWGGAASLAAAFAQTGAFSLAPGSADSALLVTLQPGVYTIHVSNAGSDPGGIALAEIYDASGGSLADSLRLINISGLGVVGPNNPAVTSGFVVTGNSPMKVLVRGIGPGLAAFGMGNGLASLNLCVFDSSGSLVAQNNNWGAPLSVNSTQVAASAADISAANAATGAFALSLGSNDAAVIVRLAPGAYTTRVTGTGGAAGAALAEIYLDAP